MALALLIYQKISEIDQDLSSEQNLATSITTSFYAGLAMGRHYPDLVDTLMEEMEKRDEAGLSIIRVAHSAADYLKEAAEDMETIES